MSADPSSHPGPAGALEDPPSVVNPVTEPEMSASTPAQVGPMPEARDTTSEQGQAPSIPDADDSQRPSSSTTSTLTNPMSGFSVGLSIDTDGSDTDSSVGDLDRASTNKSVTSSVYDFVQEFGRTFHRYKEGKYYMPNDEQEQNRLDMQHAISRRLLRDKLALAPLSEKTHRVLDIGTGTGIWAIEFAEEYPSADVLGTDLSPIQPEYVPPNCHFEIEDAEDEWLWSYNFDYIHGRCIVPFLSNLPKLMRNAFHNLSPGGYFELFEAPMWFQSVDNSLEGTMMQKWNEQMLEGVRRIGRDPMAALRLNRWMREAGFVNITEKRIAVPVNPWAKGREQKFIGTLQMTNLLEVAHGITMNVFTKALGWSVEEVEALLAQVRRDLQDKSIHAYLTVVVIYGQKPEEALAPTDNGSADHL